MGYPRVKVTAGLSQSGTKVLVVDQSLYFLQSFIASFNLFFCQLACYRIKHADVDSCSGYRKISSCQKKTQKNSKAKHTDTLIFTLKRKSKHTNKDLEAVKFLLQTFFF